MTSTAMTHATTRVRFGAAHCTVAGATTFAALLAALHVLKPDLDPSWRMISEYEIGRFGVLMQVAFLAFAASYAACVVAVQRSVTTRSGKLGLALLALAAVGATLGGLAVADPITATADQLTTHGNLHGIGAMLGIPTFPLAATLVTRALVRRAEYRPTRRRLWVLVALAWLSLAAMVAGMALTFTANGGQFGPDVPIGWPNRLLVLSYAGWCIAAVAPRLGAGGTADGNA